MTLLAEALEEDHQRRGVMRETVEPLMLHKQCVCFTVKQCVCFTIKQVPGRRRPVSLELANRQEYREGANNGEYNDC